MQLSYKPIYLVISHIQWRMGPRFLCANVACATRSRAPISVFMRHLARAHAQTKPCLPLPKLTLKTLSTPTLTLRHSEFLLISVWKNLQHAKLHDRPNPTLNTNPNLNFETNESKRGGGGAKGTLAQLNYRILFFQSQSRV